ncbi:MAG: DUF763 domain-containing protein [Candidatus Pacebacteria bacterium]|nr:DUF763 domain-containing protein [Candidatus Paceibacterota bacterium]
MIQKNIATFGLDYGICPKWLYERMVKLGREMVEIIIAEYGPDEFVKRISDPAWFQSLGTVLAFDWNASGLTTVLTASLKEAVRGRENNLGIFICGGKGKTSRKTPDEIKTHGERSGLGEEKSESLVYNSKMAAKVDGALVQDGFQIYHHSFFFSKGGAWAVVQQGMNTEKQTARRYHWHSEKATDLVCEPHSGISSDLISPTLDLSAKKSGQTRKLSAELVQGNYGGLMKDIEILRKHSSRLSRTVSLRQGTRQMTLINLETKEFFWHPVVSEDFSKSKYLEKVLGKVCDEKPENYEALLATKGVGPKTVRALSLVSEMIYGAKPSYEDPARYSFAHGGKDATPYDVDRITYDKTIDFFGKVVRKMKAGETEKRKMLSSLRSETG